MAEPLSAGAVQVTARFPWPGVRMGAAGVSGAPALAASLVGDQSPVPLSFSAFTLTS